MQHSKLDNNAMTVEMIGERVLCRHSRGWSQPLQTSAKGKGLLLRLPPLQKCTESRAKLSLKHGYTKPQPMSGQPKLILETVPKRFYDKRRMFSITELDLHSRYHHGPPSPPMRLPAQELHHSPVFSSIFEDGNYEDYSSLPSIQGLRLALRQMGFPTFSVTIPTAACCRNQKPAQAPRPKQPAKQKQQGILKLIWISQIAH